jgi:hypothetical protein
MHVSDLEAKFHIYNCNFIDYYQETGSKGNPSHCRHDVILDHIMEINYFNKICIFLEALVPNII